MSDRPSGPPSWKRRDACEAWGDRGPLHLPQEGSCPLQHLPGNRVSLCSLPTGYPGPRSSGYTVLRPSQGKNVASYLQIERPKDFKAAPAKSLAEHRAQRDWTGPHKLMGLSPGLSVSFFKSSGLGPSALGSRGTGEAGQAGGLDSSWETRPTSGPASSFSGPWHWVMAKPPPSQSSLAEHRLGSSVLRNNPLHRSRGAPGRAGDPGSAGHGQP